jgi:hypothetical protein
MGAIGNSHKLQDLLEIYIFRWPLAWSRAESKFNKRSIRQHVKQNMESVVQEAGELADVLIFQVARRHQDD